MELLGPIYNDPLDRMRVAEALAEPLTLITRDALVTAYSDAIMKVDLGLFACPRPLQVGLDAEAGQLSRSNACLPQYRSKGAGLRRVPMSANVLRAPNEKRKAA